MYFPDSSPKPLNNGILFVVALLLVNCAANAPTSNQSDSGIEENLPPLESKDSVYSIYLLGDGGGANLKPKEPVLEALQKKLTQSGKQSAVIFLGDNIYPNGLPPHSADGRKRAEKRLVAQLKTVENYPGRIIFIPGNHDWRSSRAKGLQWIRRQEEFIESYLQRGNTFLPDSGYPGPTSLQLSPHTENTTIPFNIQLLVMDTQWWLHEYNKPLSPGIKNEKQQKKQILAKTSSLLEKHKEDELLVVGHHPLYSYGRHGGYFPLKTHLLPPVFGSLYVGYRNIWGSSQDIASYRNLKEELVNQFSGYDQLIYASGHDHSLQYIPRQKGKNKQYYLVSGAASRLSHVKKKHGPPFTYRGKGFMGIHYYADRTKQVVIWDKQGRVIFRQIIPFEASGN